MAALELTRREEFDPAFLSLVASFPEGAKIRHCVQCGTCTGSCPVSYQMQHTPRKIIEMVRAGMRRAVLTSDSIWYCASCYSCSVRCPQGINLPEVMYLLRSIATATARDRSAIFYHCFSETVRRYGRLHEPALMLRYQLRTGLLGLFKNLPIGVQMLAKGKLHLLGRRIGGCQEVETLFRLAEDERRGSTGVPI